jgi:hypothetical protein
MITVHFPPRMDDMFIPDEADGEEHEALFEKREIEPENDQAVLQASGFIQITFDRFVTLVANHSFLEVVEKNKDQKVIISANLLTDLANARRYASHPKGTLVAVAGVVMGILLGYFLFT